MAQFKLPADANRIVFVRHLPDAITHSELYDLFGKHGAVEQIRLYVVGAGRSPFCDGILFFASSWTSLRVLRMLTSLNTFFESCRGRISNPDTRGKAYVVYEDVFDAKSAVESLSGQNVMGRYITVVYHKPPKPKVDIQEQLAAQRETVASLRAEMKK